MSGAAQPPSPRIHPSAIVDPRAEIDPSVTVGAFSLIGAGVRIGAGTRVGSHVVIEGDTTIGERNVFHSFARIGGDPQDKKYAGEPTRLRVGDDNTFREYVTLNRGTAQDRGETVVGSHNWIMASVHVAHDCVVGDRCILANTVNLAGHVQVGDWAILGGYTGVHQFCKVGAHAMTGVGTVILHDLPPFVMASGNSAAAHGLNVEGLRRRGFDATRIGALKRAYRTLYKSGLGLAEARSAIEAAAQQALADGETQCAADLRLLFDFLSDVGRGIVR